MKTKKQTKTTAQFESDLAGMYSLGDELETILYAVGDSEITPTEDQLMNMLIGVIELHKWRYDKLWQTYNAFCKDKGLGEYEERKLGAAYLEKRLNDLYNPVPGYAHEDGTPTEAWDWEESDEDNT